MEKKLLIIDDNREIVDIISLVLSDLFDIVQSAHTVDEAVTLLTKNCYTFILLDINLEGRNGAEIITFLNSVPENPNNAAPFIVISGVITPQFIIRHQDQFAGILMKPFLHTDLRNKVEEVLANKIKKLNPLPAKLEILPSEEVSYLKCESPFQIIQLEHRVNKIIQNTGLKKLFTQLYNDFEKQEMLNRISMLINISMAIGIEKEWNSDKTLEKFVYAAFLHETKLADESSSEENALTRTIKTIQNIPIDVALIIKQFNEHENDNSLQNMAQLSIVFIIAHDLAEYVLSHPKWSTKDYIAKSNNKFEGPLFAEVLNLLSNIA